MTAPAMIPTRAAVDRFDEVLLLEVEGSSLPADGVPVEVARACADEVAFVEPVVVASFDAGFVVSYPFSSQYRR